MKKATAEQRIFAECWKIGKDSQICIEVKSDCFYVFCREIVMYRIADAYGKKVESKGYSSNLKTHYVCVSLDLPTGFFES